MQLFTRLLPTEKLLINDKTYLVSVLSDTGFVVMITSQ